MIWNWQRKRERFAAAARKAVDDAHILAEEEDKALGQKNTASVYEEGSNEKTISCVSITPNCNFMGSDLTPSVSIVPTHVIQKPTVPKSRRYNQSQRKPLHSLRPPSSPIMIKLPVQPESAQYVTSTGLQSALDYVLIKCHDVDKATKNATLLQCDYGSTWYLSW
ncbi:hypothetical protein L1887_28799 [Cichorium endivia]|nr:hypothetical protein L1887_28799 [Cichorium endivia]